MPFNLQAHCSIITGFQSLWLIAERSKAVFHLRSFWDVDFDKLAYDNKGSFIIEGVFERGDVDDIRNCRRYYGDEKVNDVLLKAKYLP